MWTYLKNDSKSKCMNIDDYVLYVNRAEQGTSDDQARTKAVRKLVRAIIEEEGGGAHTKPKSIPTIVVEQCGIMMCEWVILEMANDSRTMVPNSVQNSSSSWSDK